MSKESKETEEITPEANLEEPVDEQGSEPAEQDKAGSISLSEEELSGLLKRLDETTAEVVEQKERYLRTVADLENYRKRALREKEEARRQANCSLIEDLLPILDNFKLGLKSAEQHEGGAVFAEGFQMILTQMESALKQNGLVEINPDKEFFDPNFHEAVAHIPHDSIGEGHIIEVHRIGYKLNDRLIRPAVVVISRGKPQDDDAEARNG